MLALLAMIVALEMMLLPVWAGLVMARSGAGLGRRLAVLPAPVIVAAVILVVLAAMAEGQPIGGVLRTQAVALGFAILLGGLAAMLGRLGGPRAAQICSVENIPRPPVGGRGQGEGAAHKPLPPSPYPLPHAGEGEQRHVFNRAAQILTALLGWLVVAAIILAGPIAGLTDGAVRETVIRAAAHSSPLLVAERELGIDWLHLGLTYRLTPLGDSYSYLIQDVAWWKTVLAYVFVGSGLAVFSLKRTGTPREVVRPE
jgi:hypothetical protein